MLYAPLLGARHALVRERRTRLDFAAVVKTLCDELYPAAEKIILVMDQLNTHDTASLYAAFAPAEARRLVKRLEIHHTPKHGSWLNMAEIELSVLARQCLDRRLPSQQALAAEVTTWQRTSATPPRQKPTGASPPMTPASNSNVSIPQLKPDKTLDVIKRFSGKMECFQSNPPMASYCSRVSMSVAAAGMATSAISTPGWRRSDFAPVSSGSARKPANISRPNRAGTPLVPP